MREARRLGRKDTVTGAYVKQNMIFADAFNYYIFGGQQVIQPDRLKELDTAEIQKAVNSHRKARDYKEHGKGEFLAGFYKEDKLIPVITLVIFFSPDEWDGPTSLHEMMNVKEERILSLVPDYQIHLIAPARLADKELKKFHSSLREVLGFIKYSNDMEKMDEIVHGDFQKLRREEIDVLNQCVNVKLELPDGEETIDVCKAWEDMKKETARKAAEEAAIKATEETEERTLLEAVSNMVKELPLSVEQAMSILKVPEAKRSKLAAKL